MSSSTNTRLAHREGGALTVSPAGWDHITVTHGVAGRPERRRTVVLAVATLVAVGLGAAALVAPPVPPGQSHPGGATTPAVHSRFGPVVVSDPTAHSRLGPVVRHTAPR